MNVRQWWCIECQELLTKVHGDETKHIMVRVPSQLYAVICAEQLERDIEAIGSDRPEGTEWERGFNAGIQAAKNAIRTAPEEEHE